MSAANGAEDFYSVEDHGARFEGLGAKYLCFFPLDPSKWEKNILVSSVCIFFEGSVFLFNFWMIKFTIMSKKT